MFLEFLSQLYRLPILFFKRVLTNPMGIFVYGILSKWYIIIMLAAVSVTYYVFKGLEESGVLTSIEHTIQAGLYDAKSVAQQCIPKITNLEETWDCIQNLKPYVPIKAEKDLEQLMHKELETHLAPDHADPYATSAK